MNIATTITEGIQSSDSFWFNNGYDFSTCEEMKCLKNELSRHQNNIGKFVSIEPHANKDSLYGPY